MLHDILYQPTDVVVVILIIVLNFKTNNNAAHVGCLLIDCLGSHVRVLSFRVIHVCATPKWFSL